MLIVIQSYKKAFSNRIGTAFYFDSKIRVLPAIYIYSRTLLNFDYYFISY
jgi:hypothetical protein